MMLLARLLSPLTYFLSFLIFSDEYHKDQSRELNFQLRHLHGHLGSRIFFADVPLPTANSLKDSTDFVYGIKTRRLKSSSVPRQTDIEAARYRSMTLGESAVLDWEEDEVEGPDIERRDTLLTLAKMTYNAYVRH